METTANYQETPATPAEIWAILRETALSQKETEKIVKENSLLQKETDRRMKETDRIMKETALSQKETDRRMQETDRQIQAFNKQFGELNNRFGEIVEYMVAPNLCKKFKDFGLIFQKANNGTKVDDPENDLHFEIDVVLENGNIALLVEVKTTLTTEEVKEHIKRLEKMRKYADLRGDKRSFMGAVAGVVMRPNVKQYALKQGFFVVEPSGETFNITPPQGQPKEW